MAGKGVNTFAETKVNGMCGGREVQLANAGAFENDRQPAKCPKRDLGSAGAGSRIDLRSGRFELVGPAGYGGSAIDVPIFLATAHIGRCRGKGCTAAEERPREKGYASPFSASSSLIKRLSCRDSRCHCRLGSCEQQDGRAVWFWLETGEVKKREPCGRAAAVGGTAEVVNIK